MISVDPPRINVDPPQTQGPVINIDPAPQIPHISFDSPQGPKVNVDPPTQQQQAPRVQVYEVPGISVAGPGYDDHDGRGSQPHSRPQSQFSSHPPVARGGLICGGCNGAIMGRIVSAMGARWHPACFKCTVCSELLEHVSSYEHEGRPYCHLDYHENFAPRCYSCKTAIIEERFISLDDPALGKRSYHEQHFFCADCEKPFDDPSFYQRGDKPYCESCFSIMVRNEV
ncbi:hypothetical protein BDQ12DRAFT_613425 [Crucibulum laeve]|uniref:LIM zinc-binding domain-containing protein n=1 Tax=Crucibulum laeve TaxID=68775 RepID=A0A5C3LMQ8_9AGAR|nr:hypothetical protein BDQ12DRAFT_613425 [Crucibulum laeve]